MALQNGDRVRISVDASGVTIKRETRRDAAEEILYVGPVHVVTEICLALLDGWPASETTVLHVFLAVVSQCRSADDIRTALAEAAAPRL